MEPGTGIKTTSAVVGVGRSGYAGYRATRGRGIRNHIPLSAAELSSAAAAGIFKSLTNSPAFVLKLLNFEFVLVGVGITADCAINQLHNSMIHETNNEQYHPTPNTAGTSLCFGQKCRCIRF